MIVTWPLFKAFVDARGLPIQWVDDGNTYFMFTYDGNMGMECTLTKSIQNSYVTEFEATYKSAGNIKLLGQKTSANSRSVTIASDQSTIPAAIKGGTDGTSIGNVGDRFKVDANLSGSQSISPSYTGKTCFDDMNASTGGVARDTSISSTTVYTQLYSYSGSGHLQAFTVSFEGNLIGSDPFNIKLEVDGVTHFEINTLDLGTSTYWSLTTLGDELSMGLSLNGNTMRFSQKGGGIKYTSNVKVYIKKASGGSKRFRGGMVYLTKD